MGKRVVVCLAAVGLTLSARPSAANPVEDGRVDAITVVEPKPAQELDALPVRVVVQLSPTVDEATFEARLNGESATSAFAIASGEATASFRFADGLKQGMNVLVLKARDVGQAEPPSPGPVRVSESHFRIITPRLATETAFVGPEGGAVTVQGTGEVRFAADAFHEPSEVTVRTTATVENDQAFADSPIASFGGNNAPYQMAIEVPNPPEGEVAIQMAVPSSFVDAEQAGEARILLAAHFLEETEFESIEAFRELPSTSSGATVSAVLPAFAFSGDVGSVRAVVLVASVPTGEVPTEPSYPACRFAQPFPDGSCKTGAENESCIRSRWGLRPNPMDPSKPPQWHAGIDLSVDPGTPVFASTDGTIVNTGFQLNAEGRGWGCYVDVRLAGGRHLTRYAHLRYRVTPPPELLNRLKAEKLKDRQAAAAEIGKSYCDFPASGVVKAGSKPVIGYSGATGGVTGPHLHLEATGGYVRPVFYYDPEPCFRTSIDRFDVPVDACPQQPFRLSWDVSLNTKGVLLEGLPVDPPRDEGTPPPSVVVRPPSGEHDVIATIPGVATYTLTTVGFLEDSPRVDGPVKETKSVFVKNPCDCKTCDPSQSCNRDTGVCGPTDRCAGVTCPGGYTCNADSGTCEPLCANVTCPDGQVCNPASGLCGISTPCGICSPDTYCNMYLRTCDTVFCSICNSPQGVCVQPVPYDGSGRENCSCAADSFLLGCDRPPITPGVCGNQYPVCN